MKSIFRATAILSASSVVTILFGLVSAKVLAVTLRPAGYGYYGLLQNFVSLFTLVTGCGMATGLVRLGAGPAARNDRATLAGLRRGAWVLFAGLASLTMVLLGIFRETLSRWALGSPQHGGTVLLMGIALCFTVAASIQVGTLNAYHQVEALAKNGVLTTLLGGVTTVGAVLLWGIHGVAPAIIIAAGIGLIVSSYFLRRGVGRVQEKSARADILKAAWGLLRFGGPYTASVVVGTGVQFALPMVVLHLLDADSVGYYKAAAAISVGYLGFLVTAMGQDYYPRTSAAAHQPELLAKLINEQHRLVMLLAIPMILGMLALVPILVPIVYSHKFTPAIDILEWQLIGDIFKFSSWTMGFAILARCSSSVYFMTESIGGVTSLIATWLAVRWFGLPGLGIGFLAAYVVYYMITFIVIKRSMKFSWTLSNKLLMLAAVGAALVVRILPATRLASFRTPIALALALAAGIPSLLVIRREFIVTRRTPSTDKMNDELKAAATTVELNPSYFPRQNRIVK